MIQTEATTLKWHIHKVYSLNPSQDSTLYRYTLIDYCVTWHICYVTGIWRVLSDGWSSKKSGRGRLNGTKEVVYWWISACIDSIHWAGIHSLPILVRHLIKNCIFNRSCFYLIVLLFSFDFSRYFIITVSLQFFCCS